MTSAIKEKSVKMGINKSELSELIGLFIETAGKEISQLGRCAAEKDRKEAACLLHSLKGAAINLDFKDFAGYCDNVAIQIDNCRFEEAKILIAQMRHYIDDIAHQLQSGAGDVSR